jgi:hypothetical protein
VYVCTYLSACFSCRAGREGSLEPNVLRAPRIYWGVRDGDDGTAAAAISSRTRPAPASTTGAINTLSCHFPPYRTDCHARHASRCYRPPNRPPPFTREHLYLGRQSLPGVGPVVLVASRSSLLYRSPVGPLSLDASPVHVCDRPLLCLLLCLCTYLQGRATSLPLITSPAFLLQRGASAFPSAQWSSSTILVTRTFELINTYYPRRGVAKDRAAFTA